MNNMIFIIVVLSMFIGCDKAKGKQIELLSKNSLDTKVGTVQNQKLIVQKKIIKVVPKKSKFIKLKRKTFKSVLQKKQYFTNILVPIVTQVYNQLENQYQTIKNDIKNGTNKQEIQRLKKLYKLKENDDLLRSLKPHPISIVLAQAAIESAWLTSRFTLEANNIFGVWSFNANEPRIAASQLRGKRTIYLKKYNTLKDAVKDYYKNLGRHRAYKEFRANKMINNNPYTLVLHLRSYSEKKDEYTKMLQKVIKYNKFDMYDINSSK